MKTKFLKQRLNEIGMTPEELAEKSGLTSSTMRRNVMRGITPSKAALMLMAQALDCEVSDLVHIDEVAKAQVS